MINQVEMDDITSRSAEYQQFLGTQEWEDFSEQIKARDGHKCKICGCTGNLVVHHVTYWGNGQRAWLDSNVVITLCRKCHHIVHECIWEARESNTVIIPETAYNIKWKSAEDILRSINYQINKTRRKDLGELISKYCVKLWERSLEADAASESIKTNSHVDFIGQILWYSIIGQANGVVPSDIADPSWIAQTMGAITELEIQKFFDWMSQGIPDIEIQERLKMTPGRWYKFMNRIYGGGTK